MAGGTINRINGGNFTTLVDGVFTGYFEKTDLYAGKQNRFKAKQTNIAMPKSSPPVGKYFVKGWWTDEDDKPIKEALIGQRVKFHIQMDKMRVPAKSKINFTLMDWDGVLNQDDPIKLYSTTKVLKTNTYPEIKEITTDFNGGALLYITLTDELVQFTEDDGGNEIELYFECSYYDLSDKETEMLDLPAEEFKYLTVYEKEVLITILIELPHSYYTLFDNPLSALGLAGHSAMAVGDRYFDYGPDYSQTIVYEKKYDYDFNDDGDKDDNIDLTELNKNGKPIYTINEKFSPGRPWWGEMVAERLGIKPNNVKLNQVLDFIKLDWKIHRTNIYGEVHKTEFYVKESEAKKMIAWWEERYRHLKVYSVWPWAGEQCTTTVKTAIQEAYPALLGKTINRISDDTQRPSGLLLELKKFISSSKQHFGQSAIQVILKPESKNFP